MAAPIVGQVRIVAQNEQEVRQLAKSMNVQLTTLKPGRGKDGFLGYGTHVANDKK